MYQVSQILLALSSGAMGVSCSQDSLFDSSLCRYVGTHIYAFFIDFVENSENLKTSKNVEVFRIFKKSNCKFYRIELYELYTKNGVSTDGMRVAGVPVGVDAWVKTFVAKKARSVITDVAKLDVVSDGLLHNQLLNFCQNDVIDVY